MQKPRDEAPTYNLAWLGAPALALARTTMAIAIACNEVATVTICLTTSQHQECGLQGTGMCGFIHAGVLLTLGVVLLLLLPETILAMFVRQEPPMSQASGAFGVIAPARFRVTMIVGSILLALLFAANVALLVYGLTSRVHGDTCSPQTVTIAFVVAATTRTIILFEVFVGWVWAARHSANLLRVHTA
jgi:hypothetical protein